MVTVKSSDLRQLIRNQMMLQSVEQWWYVDLDIDR